MSEPEDTEVEDLTEATKREGAGVLGTTARPTIVHLDRGAAVGRYIVIDVIGAGGMGVVYSAFDPVLDRKIALKLLQAKPATGGSTGDQAWLLREAQALARLSHPNVIAVHDVGTLPGDRVFVAMELVDGATLRTWMREKQRPWREVLPVLLAAGAGLAAAHAVGLVHRDFKPDNVLVGSDGRIRVMDFGLARLRPDEDTGPTPRSIDVDSDLISTNSPLTQDLTIAGTVIGTPAYMAPELRDGQAADARSDQFSFGVALYEALYHTRPFAKDAPRATKAKPPPDVGVPARIQRVVLRALALDPAERFASLDDLLAELGRDVIAPRRLALVAAGATVCLAAAVVGGFALSPSSAPAAPPPCQGIDLRLASKWDGKTKQAVRAAFVATKQPYAERSYASLESALDDYAAEWLTAAVDSCQATRVRGEQTEQVLELRTACLGQRLDELGALTKLLASADRDLVERGDKIGYGLEPINRCANVSALLATGQPPKEPADKVRQALDELVNSKAALLAGRYLPSSAAAVRASALADEIGYAPWKAEALLVQGADLVGAANSEDAAAVNREAVWAAMRGHRDDLLAAAAMSSAVLAADRKVGEAQIWLGLMKSAIARLGHDPSLEQRAMQIEGVVAAAAGDLDAAIAAQSKALEASERIYGRDSPAVWSDLEVIGVTYAKAGAFDKALPVLERALKLHEIGVGPDHPDIALILTNLGACYSHAGESAKARATYERAIAIRERVDGPRNPTIILTLNNLSDGLVKAGDPTGALLYIDRAKGLAEQLLGHDNGLYHAVATTHAETLAANNRFDDARREYDEVIALEQKTQSPYLGPTLGSRAKLALDTKRFAEAIGYAQRAIAALEQSNGKDSPELWVPLTVLGRAQLGLGRAVDARTALERALAIGEKAHLATTDLAPIRALLEKR